MERIKSSGLSKFKRATIHYPNIISNCPMKTKQIYSKLLPLFSIKPHLLGLKGQINGNDR
jgi:hypothetical protein